MLQLTDLPSDILIQIASLLSNNDSTSTASPSPFSYIYYGRTFASPTPTERLIFAGVLNNLDIFEYYLQREDKWSLMISFVCSGNIKAVQWAYANGCPFYDETLCKAAADSKNMDMLQWLHNKGCPWDESTCVAAALGGCFEMLQWLHNEGCPWGVETCAAAAVNGNLEMLLLVN